MRQDTINEHVVKAEYAVRGELVLRAMQYRCVVLDPQCHPSVIKRCLQRETGAIRPRAAFRGAADVQHWEPTSASSEATHVQSAGHGAVRLP